MSAPLEGPPAAEEAAEQFRDRRQAGQRLAARLGRFRESHPVVLGIPRGGVPVAAEVARELGAPLDVIVARKLGAPSNPEYGIGAVAEGGARVISEQAIRRLGIGPEQLAALLAGTEAEMKSLTERLRRGRTPLPVQGRTAILVDDGLATGRTALAAALSLRDRGAARVVLAMPVAASASVRELSGAVDEVVCVHMPHDLWAIGFWYEDFGPTAEEEVAALLSESAAGESPTAVGPTVAGSTVRVSIDILPAGVCTAGARAGEAGSQIRPGEAGPRIGLGGGIELVGDLTVPQPAGGVVVFAHGSGSGRHSPRNRAVAQALGKVGLATLLFDLLTPAEEVNRANVFDVPLLAGRLVAAVELLVQRSDTRDLPLGCFGASTGAAAALVAAAELGERVGAVVSRGGRPDLAGDRLGEVRAPTLLIVGGEDRQVLELNRRAQAELRCPSRLEVVPGAGHLFEEPGALEQVARLAGDWFTAHLSAAHL